MADQMVTKEKLIQANQNADSWEQYWDGTENEDVITRLQKIYPTHAKALKILAETGGFKPFLTETEREAYISELPRFIAKVKETSKVWWYEEGVWTDTGLSELDQAINFANANGLFTPINVLNNSTLLASDFKTKGWYLFVSSTPAITAGLPEPTAGFLFVISNEAKTMIHQKWMPFNSNSIHTRTSNVSGIFPPFQKLVTQSYLESQLTNYVDIVNVGEYTTKPYDIVSISKNLYDESKKQQDIIVGNNGALQAAAGWSCSDFIPVTPGEYYTISFTTKRQNLAFYDAVGTVGKLAIEYNTSTSNPLTVQAPVGAAYLVVTLDSTTITASNVQIEKGQTATTYEKGGTKYQLDASYLNTNIENSTNKLVISDNDVSIQGKLDGVPVQINAWQTKVGLDGERTVFNFAGDYVNDILQRNLNDDVAPMRMDGATIGANHGYQKSDLTLAGHGKTEADNGSVWSSGGKQYVIVDIISNNILSITSRSDNAAFSIGELVHVSGAANIASFTPTATVSKQWYPSIRDRKLNCFVDDVKIDLTQSVTYDFKKTVKFLESYSIMKKSDIIEWLIINKGVNHANYNAVPAYTVNFGYAFDHECGCTIYFGGVGRKTVDLVDQMVTQSIQLAQGNGTVYNYIPKATEFTAGGFTYNFSQLENLYSKNPSEPLYLTAARQEAGTNPIDRIIMLNNQVGYATGYLPILDAAPSVRPNNASRKYLEIRNGTLKLYPRLIDSASIMQINKGDTFEAIAYRVYFLRDQNCTAKYTVRSTFGDFFFLHWHTFGEHEVDLPADLVGREFEVVEKSSNVTLLSTFASNSIIVDVVNEKIDGYLVLKFK